MRKIIVDIDNTLWRLAPVLYDRMREACPGVPPVGEEPARAFLRSNIEPKTIYTILDAIHMEQDMFPPYDDAAAFLWR